MLGLAKTISDLYGKISSALTSSSKYTDDAVKSSVETCNKYTDDAVKASTETCNKYTDEQITKVKQQSSGTLHGSIVLNPSAGFTKISHSIGHTDYSIVVNTTLDLVVRKNAYSVEISLVGELGPSGLYDYIISY